MTNLKHFIDGEAIVDEAVFDGINPRRTNKVVARHPTASARVQLRRT